MTGNKGMLQQATRQRAAGKGNTALDIELRRVFKVFHGETAVRSIDLEVRRGEFFSILGPSGSGKTTTLRLVAGFETPSAGEVIIRGQPMQGVPPYRRLVNTVFQSYALFNHMSVWDNVAFGLRIQKTRQRDLEERVRQTLQLVKMDAYAHRLPNQLSGGQQQRVALARALVNRPAVVLLDEPLGSLDQKLRKEMQVELSNLHQELGITFMLVTHDQEEALSLSDRIAVMNHGRIEQVGTPSEIYECPRSAFVADFIGDTNLLQGRVARVTRTNLQAVTASGLPIEVESTAAFPEIAVSDPVTVSVRPEKIHLSLEAPAQPVNCFEGRLRHVLYRGSHVHYRVELLSGDRLMVLQPNTMPVVPDHDTPIYVHWAATDCLVLTA